MAFPTFVNDQVIDSVTIANTQSLGVAPAVAMGISIRRPPRPWPMQRTTRPWRSSRCM